MNIQDVSLIPPVFVYQPDDRFSCKDRLWQSAPSAAMTGSGRIFCVYSGDNVSAGETTDNYTVCSYSDDCGSTFHLAFYAFHEHDVRMSETLLFLDSDGILYHFWTQSYEYFDGRGGIWCCKCEDPDAEIPEFGPPIRICDGFMAHNPTKLKSGKLLFPASVWTHLQSAYHPFPEYEKVSVWESDARIKTLTYLGGVEDNTPSFSENTIFEINSNHLVMLFRSQSGIKRSDSFDQGKTWTPAENFVLPSPSSRFMVSRLPSGALLIVTHYHFNGRNNLTALLSYDNGVTFPYSLLLDERKDVSYPSGNVTKTGRVILAYDRERTDAKEILLASFSEEDIQKNCFGTNSFTKRIVSVGGQEGYL